MNSLMRFTNRRVYRLLLLVGIMFFALSSARPAFAANEEVAEENGAEQMEAQATKQEENVEPTDAPEVNEFSMPLHFKEKVKKAALKKSLDNYLVVNQKADNQTDDAKAGAKKGATKKEFKVSSKVQTNPKKKNGPMAYCVKFVKKSVTITQKQKKVLRYVIKPGTSVEKPTFESSNNGVVTINSHGCICGIKEGRAKVYAKLKNGKKAACTVIVKGKKIKK
ncbi:MAG: Ig-like domain-containing protein [Lachnospiraceae bacterium]|nr:Ig-like domain-containing protein [Lachnospiraceae bacterium]